MSLGSPARYPNAYSSNWIRPGELGYATGGNNSQETWAAGSNTVRHDECEIENEHGGDIQDEDHDAQTWRETIDQSNLGFVGRDDDEPELGWTDHVDQTKAMVGKPGWKWEDGEPDLGFVGIATGWTPGEGTDDREQCPDIEEGSLDEDCEPDTDAEHEMLANNCPVASYCEIAFRRSDDIIVREVSSC